MPCGGPITLAVPAADEPARNQFDHSVRVSAEHPPKQVPACLDPVPIEQQWLDTTRSRVARDPYSWLQAVCWAVDEEAYTPRRTHGPRAMGPTTMQVALLLADLSPCRPGIAFLVRMTQLGERTIEYHLGMLRDAGFLIYIERGTRVRGEAARASHFVLTIPPAFDTVLEVRTLGVGPERRVVGISAAGRAVMARLGTRVSRMGRRPKRRPRSSPPTGSPARRRRCTPMEAGPCTSPSDGSIYLPSESGPPDQPTAGAPSAPQRGLNRVGRRYQLAWELVQQVPWLRRAAVPRIAWIARHVADAGWTSREVLAWLDLRTDPGEGRVRRPSAFLAARLRGAPQLLPEARQRQRLVDMWLDSRRAAAARHREVHDSGWFAPRDPGVRQQVGALLSAPDWRPGDQDAPVCDTTRPPAAEALSATELLALRDLAVSHPALVLAAVRDYGVAYARDIYGADLVVALGRYSGLRLDVWRSR